MKTWTDQKARQLCFSNIQNGSTETYFYVDGGRFIFDKVVVVMYMHFVIAWYLGLIFSII